MVIENEKWSSIEKISEHIKVHKDTGSGYEKDKYLHIRLAHNGA